MTAQHEFFRMAELLEKEAARLRMLVHFEPSKHCFVRDVQEEAQQTIASLGPARESDDDDIRMVRAIAAGEFDVTSVVGGDSPCDSEEGVEEYARAVTLVVNGESFDLNYRTLVSDDGHWFDEWDEAHEPTKAFVEAHPLTADMLNAVLDKCHEDFHRAPSPMGDLAFQLEVMLRQRMATIDAEQKQGREVDCPTR